MSQTYNNIITIPSDSPTGTGGTEVINSLKALADGEYTYNGSITRTRFKRISSAYCETIDLGSLSGKALIDIKILFSTGYYEYIRLAVQMGTCGALAITESKTLDISSCQSSIKDYISISNYNSATLSFIGGCGVPDWSGSVLVNVMTY